MDNAIQSITPQNIDDLTPEEVFKLLPEVDGVPPMVKRYKVIQLIYQILGYSLSNDALLALLFEGGPQLCLATAGGGKTTFAQIKIILEKIWMVSNCYSDGSKLNGENVLCLVYNRHNISQMEKKQRYLINKINMKTASNFNLDDKINACTMHSFCDRWRKKYASKMGMIGFTTISEMEVQTLFKMAIDATCTKLKCKKIDDVNIDSLISLYNYQRETLSSYEDLQHTDKYYDIGLSIEMIESVFDIYGRLKKMRKKYDFTDMLLSFYELIKTDKEVLKHIQSYYGYVVADEIQDFTPIMWEILQLITNDGTPLVCIGDEDQNIYSFRGADIYNTLYFKDKFSNGEIFLLSRNRRCREEILNVARKSIEKNTLRFNKQLLGVKPGGNVKYEPYSSTQGQFLKIVSSLKRMTAQELENSVICYREKETSADLIEMLANECIPFHVLSGYLPYTHEIYTHIFQIMDLLESPKDPYCHLNLYKVLPVSKNDLYKVLGYDAKSHKFIKGNSICHFNKINYEHLVTINGFTDVIKNLSRIAEKIQTEPLKNYFLDIFKYFKCYYWNFKKTMNNTSEYDDLFEKRIIQMFMSDLTYQQFYNMFDSKKKIFKRNNDNNVGLAVSTFHGLKGLEYDNCFLINLDDEIFPNYSIIDSKEYPSDIKLSLKESERRLFYVAVTRARDNLYLYYKEDNPSLYIQELLNNSTTKIEADKELIVTDPLDADYSLNCMDLDSLFDDDIQLNESDLENDFADSIMQTELKSDSNNDAMKLVSNYDVLSSRSDSNRGSSDIVPTIKLGDSLSEAFGKEEATVKELKNVNMKNPQDRKVYKLDERELKLNRLLSRAGLHG